MNKHQIHKLRDELIPLFEAETGLNFANKPEWVAWLSARAENDTRLQDAFTTEGQAEADTCKISKADHIKLNQERLTKTIQDTARFMKEQDRLEKQKQQDAKDAQKYRVSLAEQFVAGLRLTAKDA